MSRCSEISHELKPTRVQTAIATIWNPLADALFEALIPADPRGYISSRKFINYPEAIDALDATLLPLLKPKTKGENKACFSGRHWRRGTKLQLLVAPDGMCINYGGIIPGTRNDFYLHQSGNLCKLLACRSRSVDGSYSISHPQILCDGGYRGIEASYPEAVLPIGRLPHQHLSDEHKGFNRKLNQDRVIVERFFGRLKGYWALMQNPYRSDRNTVDTLARTCVCLTNLKIRDDPLYSIEHIYDPDHVKKKKMEKVVYLTPTHQYALIPRVV